VSFDPYCPMFLHLTVFNSLSSSPYLFFSSLLIFLSFFFFFYFLYTLMFHFLMSLLKRGRAVFLTVCLINLCLSRLLIDGIREVTDCSV
jgi:hypothetical protein